MENLVSRAQVAQQLGVSVDTVKRLTYKGALRCVKVGSRAMYSPEEIENFVKGGGHR